MTVFLWTVRWQYSFPFPYELPESRGKTSLHGVLSVELRSRCLRRWFKEVVPNHSGFSRETEGSPSPPITSPR